jgi:hypothetical protein
MLTDLSGDVPRVIALIDAHDLQWQVKRIGGAFGYDLNAVLEQLGAGVAKLNPAPEKRLRFALVHVYAPLEAEWPQEAGRSGEFDRVVFKPLAGGINRACWSCAKACTHCQEGTKGSGRQGHDNPIHGDLLEFARDDVYDWAVIVTADLLLIPVIRYLQSHGREVIHGCFPPVAMDLTEECWASIDLRPLNRGPA